MREARQIAKDTVLTVSCRECPWARRTRDAIAQGGIHATETGHILDVHKLTTSRIAAAEVEVDERLLA